MLLDIVILPDPVLSAVAEPVGENEFGPELDKLISNMFETLYAAPGVGLAAPQIGLSKQLVVIDLFPGGVKTDEDREWLAEQQANGYQGPIVLINAKIIEKEGSTSIEEGCLSLPGVAWEVRRAKHIIVEALDQKGQKIIVDAKGFYAICIQHELDHLRGFTLVNYMSKIRQGAVIKRLRKYKENAALEK